MVEATDAKGLDVPGFDGARLFTARDRGSDGVLYFRAFEGRYGFTIAEHHLKRNVCESEAKRILMRVGRKVFEETLAARVISREAASEAGQAGRPPDESAVRGPVPVEGSSGDKGTSVRGQSL